MALNKNTLYQQIYSDLANIRTTTAETHEAGAALMPTNARGIVHPTVFNTADDAPSKLLVDQIASTVADRVVDHIQSSLQTSEAETQLIALKDATSALVDAVDAVVTSIDSAATSLSLVVPIPVPTDGGAIVSTQFVAGHVAMAATITAAKAQWALSKVNYEAAVATILEGAADGVE